MEKDCRVDPISKNPSQEELETESLAFLQVWGMGCPNCANRVRNSLISRKGVIEAIVQHTIGLAQIAFNPDLITVEDLIAAVVSAGGDGRHEYEARLISQPR